MSLSPGGSPVGASSQPTAQDQRVPVILRMRRVNAVDATGMHALDEFHDKCRKQGTRLLLAGVHAQPMFAMTKYGLLDKIGEENMFGNVDDALNRARELIGVHPQPKPATAVAEVARERV